ncbi:MAG: hypothetical protein H8E98_02975 [Bacteroidetes bacterium]|nr:hypothetical protein [Bacteroidota bacterium]
MTITKACNISAGKKFLIYDSKKIQEILIKNKTSKKVYFTKLAEEAIIAYNIEESKIIRDKIYTDYIYEVLNKLAENVIHSFGCRSYLDIPYEDFKHEVVLFLTDRLHMYERKKGKAFSYFTVVGRNYCIVRNQNNYNILKNRDDITTYDDSSTALNTYNNAEKSVDLKNYLDEFLVYLADNIHSFFSKQNDLKVAEAFIKLMGDREYIENYNKKALYILLKEMTGLTAQQITRVLSQIKVIFNRLYDIYCKEGTIQ